MMSNRISFHSRFSRDALPEFKVDESSDFPNVNILNDIVLKKMTAGKSEFMYQKFFSDKVLEGVSQNFPLLYNHNDEVFSMEKFDGDFFNFNEEDPSVEELMSFFLQIIMALYVIDSYGKFHGDLNPKNVFYKKIEGDDDGSLKYVFGGETYYVKHYNRLWVVGDFEYMGDKGEDLSKLNDSYDNCFFRRLFGERYEENKIVKGSWLYDMYVIAHYTGASKMADRVYNIMIQECSMTPIEAIYHIIKNDITDIFVKE